MSKPETTADFWSNVLRCWADRPASGLALVPDDQIEDLITDLRGAANAIDWLRDRVKELEYGK